MTYNWNTMVEITVPTGTNGWLYSGEVIINGVKVRFPVGVPTSVPEPAAVLLQKMIELEQEEDANTAKPQNHYVGDVTIPAGKTLTLEKGAKFVDNSGPSEVVILPETELAPEDGAFFLTAPFAADFEDGKTYAVTFHGETYDCKAVYLEDEGGMSGFLLGNIPAEAGVTGGNPDAPFVIMYSHHGGLMGQAGMYCFIQVTAELESWDGVSPVTLSIVQTEGAESGGAADSPVVIAKMTGSGDAISIDKTFDEIVALVTSGKIVYLQSIKADAAMTLLLTNYTGSSTPKTLFFAGQNADKMVVTVTYTPDGVTMGIENH